MTSMLMLDRRTFLVASVAVTAGNYLQASPLVGRAEAPALFVCDRRFEATLRTRSPQAEVVFIEGDVTALWRDRLSALWRDGTARVDGITRPTALFCLEQLARGSGHDVAQRRAVAGTDAIAWTIYPVSLKGFT